MSSEIKYLFAGLAIALVIMSLLATGIVFANPALIFPTATPTMTDSPTPSPSPTATSTSQPSPTPSFTPSPMAPPTLTATATLDPIHQMLNSGQLVFSGALTDAQQIALYQSSIQYIATTPADSIRISKQINGVLYGNPSNTCGPLAIAIMRDAGLISNEIVPHDFWLLNPFIPDDRAKLTHLFPSDQYNHMVFTTPLNKMNWTLTPLEPGDFLYIHAGGGGNFDHMLVVSRVDANHRAFSVTNFDTSNGFIIDERMLYDPNDDTLGLFHDWTEVPLRPLGSTGYGGIEIWRLRAP